MARAMLVAGVLATLAANAYSGLGHGAAGMVLAMWPAVAFIGSSEVGLRMVRQSADDKVAAAKAAARAAKPVTRTADANRKIKRARTLLTAEPTMATADLARKLSVTPGTARKYRELAVAEAA
jgi:DeoR/GlpR family transcriptional regulator of sugar metabolism